MTEQLLHETRISITRLAREQDVSIPTVWRWTKRGIKGRVLESFSCGGRRYVTRESFLRWIAAINGESLRGQTRRQRQRQIKQAERRAEELGL